MTSQLKTPEANYRGLCDATEDLERYNVSSYSPFEFSHEHIPESFVQEAATPWGSHYKVDQLPNKVTENDISSQLQDAGFEKVDERGEFEIYSDGSVPHAVGEDRHVMVLPGINVSGSKAKRLMNRVVKEANQDAYEVPDAIEDGLDVLDVRDSLTIENTIQNLGYTPSTESGSLQPEYGLASVDLEEGTKSGAWPFESQTKAEKTEDVLSRTDDLWGGYENVGRQGRVVTATGGDYQIEEEMNDGSLTRFSKPRI